MTITELQQQYAAHPNMAVMKRLLKDTSVQTVFCGGLCASAASLFSSVLVQEGGCPFVFILGDLEEAGYFYHDLTQILGTERVLFFPSSFRRSIKYGQKDAANEILRTEVLSRLQKGEEGLCIVTYPDALAEKVVSRKELSNKTLKLNVGEKVDTTFITDVLHSYGFECVDYVYEPGQYAVRGSIIDVFSFASEYPYRIDFFGDEVESVRTFEVESQLSREKKDGVSIVPDLAVTGDVTTSFLDFIPKETTLAMRDFLWLRERIQVVHDEALTPQAIAVQEAEENGGITLEGKLIDGSEINQFNGSEEVKNNLMGLVKYLRRSLELTEKLSVPLQDELDFVRSYIDLENGRVGEDFIPIITVEDGLDATRIMIPSMIVQIPVENAIKHGLAGKDGAKGLTISVSRQENGIRITITDNGRGYLPQLSSATRGTGTGLKVLYQTIQLLNTKNKSDKIRFDITNRNDGQTGTQASVYIPFRFSYDSERERKKRNYYQNR